MSIARLARSTPHSTAGRSIGVSLRPGTRFLQTCPSSTPHIRNLSTSFARYQLPQVRQYASAATATASLESSEAIPVFSEVGTRKIPVLGAETLIPVLQDIQQLLDNDIGGDDLWSRRVEDVIEDLQSERRGRIAVIGDDLAAPKDVVSALLQDPLADSEETRRALLDRHEGSNIETFQISHGLSPRRESQALTLSSSWLQLTGFDVIELNAKKPEDTISSLLPTETLLVVLDPIRLIDTPQLSSILPLALSKGSVHFAINGHLPPNTSQSSIETKFRDQLAKIKVDSLQDDIPFNPSSISVSFVNSEKALNALEALSAALQDHGPSTSSAKTRAFETFQNQFLASYIGPLQTSLLTSVQTISEPQITTARQTAALTMSHVENVISSDRDIVKNAIHTVTELRRGAQQGASKAKHLSVASRGIEGGLVEGSVEYDTDKIKTGLEEKFLGRLSWLGLIGRTRVDDIQFELGDYLNNEFGVELEKQIIFETGKLSNLQFTLDSNSDHIIRQLQSTHPSNSTSPTPNSTHPFTSPLLLNHLSTLSLSIPPLSPASLTTPIIIRRRQLLTQSIPRLHTSAQRALLTTYATSLLGVSSSWMSFVPPISLTSASTAIGLGILSIVASLALGQRLWGRAQRKFWRDWKRITGMMKGDLETRFDTALRTQVLAKPLSAAEGLEKLIERRERRLDELQDQINQISKRI
ncbi:uncharacterized protein IL334_002350 [Kwoniella shivajii]|uniref:Mmc1 C-terminal domain-containing protein n=1 Tax=Kwoniella shivajii TaxID=564305 RepID=A0ABZ1CUI0_9TREE|nr:hypothetical protein IL334_002350 [Kwoniella shivajii]